MVFFSLALHFKTFLLWHVQKSKFWDKKVTLMSLGFSLLLHIFCHSFFSFSYLFAAVLTYWACSELKFHSNFWAFPCLFQAPLSRSLKSGYNWKDLFLLQKLSIDDANFGQRWWCQKYNKGQDSSQAVMGGMGVYGLISVSKCY